MSWIKKNPHLFVLLLVSVFVITGSVLITRQSRQFRHAFDWARQNKPPVPSSPALDFLSLPLFLPSPFFLFPAASEPEPPGRKRAGSVFVEAAEALAFLLRSPMVPCGDGHVFWTTVRENRLFLTQRYKMGDVGKLVRRAKRDINPRDFRIITSTEPFYEVVVAETEEAIMFALTELIEKQLMPRVFGMSHAKVNTLLPSLIKALQTSNPEQALDTVMANYHSQKHRKSSNTACTHCKHNDRNALFEPCGHQIICVGCADTLALGEQGLVCPSCDTRVQKVVKIAM